MSELNCQIELPGASPEKPLTVGDKFILSCDGEMATPLPKSAQFMFETGEMKYTLHVLDVQEATTSHAKFVVTSYKPGGYPAQSLKITDGASTYVTQNISWQVNSVLKEGGQPQPVPSQGPFLIHYPLWFWLIIGGLVLAALTLLGSILYRRKKARALRAELESYVTMLAPFAQFSRDMRAMGRQIDRLKSDDGASGLLPKLDEDFRLYLVRELMVPAHKFSDARTLRAIKQQHAELYKLSRVELKRVLSELTKAKHDVKNIKLRDCHDLFFLSRTVAEKIHKLKRKGNG